MEDAVEQRTDPPQAKNKNVADRVAARYAKAPTYSEMLANEARNVARAAEAAAVAAGEARDAAQAILVGLDVDRDAEDFTAAEPVPVARTANPSPRRVVERLAPRLSNPLAGTARLSHHRGPDEEDESRTRKSRSLPSSRCPPSCSNFLANSVAARRARPRLAEGPLREEYDRDSSASQLRIFEVEQETISTAPDVEPVLPDGRRFGSILASIPRSRLDSATTQKFRSGAAKQRCPRFQPRAAAPDRFA